LTAQVRPARSVLAVSVAMGGGWPALAPDGVVRCVGERRAPSARAGSRATPRQVVPDHREACAAAFV